MYKKARILDVLHVLTKDRSLFQIRISLTHRHGPRSPENEEWDAGDGEQLRNVPRLITDRSFFIRWWSGAERGW